MRDSGSLDRLIIKGQLVRLQRQADKRAAVLVCEPDLEHIGSKFLHDSSDLSASEFVVSQLFGQLHHVQNLDLLVHSSSSFGRPLTERSSSISDQCEVVKMILRASRRRRCDRLCYNCRRQSRESVDASYAFCGMSEAEILDHYRQLTKDDIHAVRT